MTIAPNTDRPRPILTGAGAAQLAADALAAASAAWDILNDNTAGGPFDLYDRPGALYRAARAAWNEAMSLVRMRRAEIGAVSTAANLMRDAAETLAAAHEATRAHRPAVRYSDDPDAADAVYCLANMVDTAGLRARTAALRLDVAILDALDRRQ